MRVAFFSWLLTLGLAVSGQPQVNWIRQYTSGFSPAFDFAYAIAVDGSDNVIVVGSSWGSNQLPDIVTIKYNNVGNTLWVRRWNGPGDNWDIGRALAVDASGNIYVTGETYSNSTFFDFVTIKYDAAGNQLWEAIYDGPLNSEDASRDIAVDGSGNVYVIGYSNWVVQNRADFATIKYNSSGQQQWVRTYNGPGSQADFGVGISLDPSGNVYVTGTEDDLSVTHYPAYATVKYNSDGVQQWVNRYNELWSYAADIAVDASGNSYVTGHSYASQGGFYDYATVKYNSAGAQQWVRRYDGPGSSDDYAKAIKVDQAGNVYVTGEAFFLANNGSDYATIKYSASGTQQWVARYNGPGNSVDVGNAIILDAGGNVYVTGESRGVNGDDDFATVKYNPAGVEQWGVRHTSPGNEVYDLASGLAIDAAGCVCVTGRSNQVGSSVITTIKYCQNVILPVNLVEFAAEYKNGVTTLKWKTLTETNKAHFEIQRGFNGNDFNEIGNVIAAGNNLSLQQYTFEDRSPQPGINFYRLKIIDADGKAEYSKIVSIKTGDAQESITIFPNPVTDKTIILQLNNLPHGTFKVELYNSIGQVVYKNKILYSGGSLSQTIKLPGSTAEGLYHLHVYSGEFRFDQKLIIR
jgi:uncharacterized delta-60 repeat protein